MGRALPISPENPEELAWELDAACQGSPDPFYPVGRESGFDRAARETVAKKFCANCSVQEECLEYALDHDERDGIWGGLTETERRLRQRAIRRMGLLLSFTKP